MAGIWSAIKGAPDHLFPDGALRQHQAPGPNDRPPLSSTRLLIGGPAPRPPASVDPRCTASPSSTTTQPAAPTPSKRTPSRRSRSSTAVPGKEKECEKDRRTEKEKESDAQNADETPQAASSNSIAAAGHSAARATPPPSLQSPASASAIDPLSQHIFLRTNTDHSIPHRLRHPSRPESPTHMAEAPTPSSVELGVKTTISAGDATKDKSKKGNSFLSRLGMRGIKKKDAGDLDSDSEFGSEARMDGINALVFGQSLAGPFAGVGYTPHHKEPPRYIRTKANNKKTREFNRMFLAQELVGTQPPSTNGGEVASTTDNLPTVTVSVAGANGRKVARTGGAIWASEFSKDGKYFATAGKDHVVRIWAVLSTPEERRAYEEEEIANGGTGERLSAPVFRGRPAREFDGHTGEVLDLSWSKNSFLLSSSMDKTVRLWHISRNECLCTFKHKDFVTRLAFHPRDDRFFLAGSLDTMLRLWSIPDKSIAFSAQLPDLVTAVAFSPDGKTAIAGLLNGMCLFYETEGLKFQSQIHVRSSRGKNAKGSKITNIQAMHISPPNVASTASQALGSGAASRASTENGADRDVRVLITSNDSRIRLYSLRDKALEVKLKGHDNVCSQIAASFSDDGNYVICGSEDRKTFIWSLDGSVVSMQDKDKSPCEYFEAHGDMVTTALFAPTKTRILLGQSGDPIYDLCNPPPVVLRSLEEAASATVSQTALSADEPVPLTPSESLLKRPEPSPAYVARSTHYDGNIIVTTDDTGIIKVFRQDCAFVKRRHESWETGSTLSRKLTAHHGGFVASGLGRSASILTRTSASSAAHSRRGSLSQSVGSGVLPSPQLGGTNSDRILSWRQSIENGSDRRGVAAGVAVPNGGQTPARTERSPSPSKRTPLGASAANLASDARKQPYAGSSPVVTRANSTVTSPTASVFSSNTPDRMSMRLVKNRDKPLPRDDEPAVLPTPSFTLRPAMADEDPPQGDQPPGNHSFWNLNRWRGITGFKTSSAGQGHASGHSRGPSTGSVLSRPRVTMDGSSDEKELDSEGREKAQAKGKEKEKADRRQSLGLHGLQLGDGAESSRRRSLPPSSASLGQAATSDSDVQSNPRSIPTIRVADDEGDDVASGINPVRVRHDGSPYRHLWSGGSSVPSRLSSDLDSDIEEEVEGEGDGEEMMCAKCGGKDFKARRVASKQRFSCGRCGALLDE